MASRAGLSKRRLGAVISQLTLALLVGGAGCAVRRSPGVDPAGAQTAPPQPGQTISTTTSADKRRLEEVWQSRRQDPFGSKELEFSLGPGDVLEISVPLEQLKHREVRVSANDTISLPLVGLIRVKGLTEQGLTDVLRQRLSEYMYDPPLSVFVKHYANRQVAVVGAVQKPGLYTVMSGSDTLMNMISKAGGMTDNSAAEVIFVPAGSGGGEIEKAGFPGVIDRSDSELTAGDIDSLGVAHATNQTGGGTPGHGSRVENEKVEAIRARAPNASHRRTPADFLTRVIARFHPIVISMSDPAEQTYLEMPARPGDVLMIPAAGEVTVSGWVQNPGAYKIAPGMTALSAISAAGGALFSYTAEVLRTSGDGQRESIPVDISEIQNGEERDVRVQSGDVVMVDRSPIGAVPYALYEVFTKFGTGMYLPAP